MCYLHIAGSKQSLAKSQRLIAAAAAAGRAMATGCALTGVKDVRVKACGCGFAFRIHGGLGQMTSLPRRDVSAAAQRKQQCGEN